MKLFGIIGHPLGHSYSKDFFEGKFKKQGLKNYEYEEFDILNADELLNIIQQRKDLEGLNVTIPFKKTVLEYLDEVDETATKVGAVNVIVLKHHNNNVSLKGYNTDVYGFEKSLKPLLKSEHKNALILGTGGAAMAAAYVMRKLHIDYIFVSREKSLTNLMYDKINEEVMLTHKLIINCTPVGMYPHIKAAPDIPYQFISSAHLLYDMIYNPEETLFLQKGKEQKAKTKNGLEMLQLQAEKSWEIFNNKN